MSTIEETSHLKEADRKGLLDKLGRSKAARVGAISLSAVGLAAGAFEGGKKFMESIPADRAATPIELVSRDTTGYMADIESPNGNNPNILFEYVKNLPKAEQPYFIAKDQNGQEVRINIVSPGELVAKSWPNTGEQLTIAGLTARDMYLRSHQGDLQNIQTPALKTGGGDISKQHAEGFGGKFYTGSSKNAPDLSLYHEGDRWQLAGDNVEVVIPPQPNKIAQ